jgi:hypothetical protein
MWAALRRNKVQIPLVDQVSLFAAVSRDRMSGLDQSHRFDRGSATSGLPL